MAEVKLSVVYYSAMGTNYQLAREAAAAAQEAECAVRLRRVPELAPEAAVRANPAWLAHYEATRQTIPEATLEDLDWADALVFAMPTRYGNIAAQMKQFLDTTGPLWSEGKLAKPVTAMTSAANPHGGQETTLLAFYVSMCHWGAIIVPPGYLDPSVYTNGGNPYGTSVAQPADGHLPEEARAQVRYQTRRLIAVAERLAPALVGERVR